MTRRLRLGKRPARHDHRVPYLHKHAAALPLPPPSANWHDKVPAWGMLANDQVGDCVEAAVLHQIYQNLCYTMPDAAPVPTDQDAIDFYAAAAGYVPGNASTDQGSVMIGPGGVMEFWQTKGVPFAGTINQVSAYLQVSIQHPVEWRQAISIFGSLLFGLQVPESIINADTVPAVWSDASGPVAGGHEILLVGYETTGQGVVYDLVSWGALYKATEAFLLATTDEAVCAYDKAFLTASGLDPAGIDQDALMADMDALRIA